MLGLFSYRQLGVDQFPNVDYPIVVVDTLYPGASPETVESEVSRKIEEAVNAITGIKTLSSRSSKASRSSSPSSTLGPSAMPLQDVREKVPQIGRPSGPRSRNRGSSATTRTTSR